MVVWALGCQEQNTQAPIEGIKLSDLSPADSRKQPSKIFFRMFIFEMPAEHFTSVKDIFKKLSQKPLRFVNADTFKANGFEVGFGYNRMWESVATSLRQLEARKVTTKDILIFDDADYDIAIAGTDSQEKIPYITNNRMIAKVDLEAGKLIWRIKARVLPQRRATINARILPVFSKAEQNRFAKLLGKQSDNETVFSFAGFGLNMSEEDFVIIGPGRYNQEQKTLSSLFFTLNGDFVLHEPSEYGQGDITFKKQVTLKKNVPLIRLYMIVCAKVRN